MEEKEFSLIFSDQRLKDIFPETRADQFFEALYGDIQEGAYTISLKFKGIDSDLGLLHFDLELKERPGKCLACNLTYGLPEVFSRHPIINVRGLVKELEKLVGNGFRCGEWSLGQTLPVSNDLHAIPLRIKIDDLRDKKAEGFAEC
jgi:hypothetical protein